MRNLILILCLLLFPATVFADDHAVACSGNISSTLQSAITAASDGDTVTIGNGSCTLNAAVTITDKNITIQGGGIGVTTLACGTTGNLFNFAPSTKPFRITGFTVNTSANNDSFILIRNACNQSVSCNPPDIVGIWRVDHIRFNVNSGGRMYPCIQVTQDDPGVVDSCYFYAAGSYLIGMRNNAANGLYDVSNRTEQWGELARTRATGMGT